MEVLWSRAMLEGLRFRHVGLVSKIMVRRLDGGPIEGLQLEEWFLTCIINYYLHF